MEFGDAVRAGTATLSCDGGAKAGSHPQACLHIGPEDETVCPRCSCRYVAGEDAPRETGD